ncbi:MAG: glycine betaine ABC transporter substrate-binding protein [Alphaproteobacteria bacterium]|jgi:glycine betaine/proline transport system substrate-binding protein
MMKRVFVAGALTVAMMVGQFWVGVAGAACGKVTIAEMNWASAQAAANIDRLILKHGYGCDVETVPGDTVPTMTSMTEKGKPDIAPELWLNSIKPQIARAVKEGRIEIAGDVIENPATFAGEGWFIPKYMVAKNPALATLAGVLANPHLFKDPEDPAKGRFLGCPAGWACQINNENMFKARGMAAKGWNLVDPGSGAALAGAIAKAVNRGQAVFAYYWAPTALLAKYAMHRLNLGPHDRAEYVTCTAIKDCPTPKPNSFAVAEIKTVVSAAFAKKANDAYTYIRARSFGAKEFGDILIYMNENRAGGEDAARYFLKKYPKVWGQWVPADVAAKVKAALTTI